MNTLEIIKWLTVVLLVLVGAFMIYEGISYIQMKKKNNDIPDTIYAAAVLSIFIGICEVAFGIAHIWF
jgi:putative Mn2+ efflux pump MntP